LFAGIEAMKPGKRLRGRELGAAELLERRVGEREHLLQTVELVHHAQPLVHVPQRRHLGKGLHRRVVRHQLAHAVEDLPGHEVVEDVDHWAPRRSRLV
jgi:hypothetical protein